VLGDHDVIVGEVKVAVSFVIRGMTKEDVAGRPWSKLVGSGYRLVRVAKTPKNPKVLIGRLLTM
jgi:hypothetical protein